MTTSQRLHDQRSGIVWRRNGVKLKSVIRVPTPSSGSNSRTNTAKRRRSHELSSPGLSYSCSCTISRCAARVPPIEASIRRVGCELGLLGSRGRYDIRDQRRRNVPNRFIRAAAQLHIKEPVHRNFGGCLAQLGTYIAEAILVGFPVPFMRQFGTISMGIFVPVVMYIVVGTMPAALIPYHKNFQDSFA